MDSPEPSVSVSELSWSWVVEALANSPEVDVGNLYDLVQGMPNLYDILGRNAKLRVALRCLEGICDSAKGLEGFNGSPSRCSNFDSSQSLESILHQIQQETPLSNSEKLILPEVASDLCFSIEHRKAYLPQIALEQLKVIRREGHDPMYGSFEKLRGLISGSLPEQTLRVNRNDFEETHKNSNLMQLEQEAEKSCRNEDAYYAAEEDKDNTKKDTDADMELDRNKSHQEAISAGGDNCRDDVVEHLEQEAERSCTNMDEDYAADKGKDDSEKCIEADMELDPHNLHQEEVKAGGEIHKDNDLIQLELEAERSHGSKDGDYALGEGNSYSKKCIKADVELDHHKPHQEEVTVGGENCHDNVPVQMEQEADRSGRNVDGENAAKEGDHNSKKCTEVDMELGHHKPRQEDAIVDRENHKTNDHIQLEQEAERSCGTEYGDYADGSKKYTDADMELVYETPHQEVSVGGENHKNNDFTQLEQEVDRSCRNGDEDYAAEEGNENSKKYTEEDIDLQWAEQQKICTKCNKDGDVLTCSSCPIVVHQRCLGFSASSKNRTFSCPVCTYSNAVAEVTKARRELSLFISGTPGFQMHTQSKRVTENVLPSSQIEDMEKNNCVDHGETSSSDKDKDGSSGFLDADATPSKMKNTNLNNSSLSTHIEETEKKKMAEHHTENGSNQNKKQKQVENENDKGFHDEKGAFDGKTQVEEVSSHDTKESQHLDQPKDASSATSLSEENSEDDRKKSPNSKYSLRHLKRKNPSVQTSTQLPGRRNRNIWTVEEEETLKEGIRRFASGHAQTMPWKSILEFGQSVFSRHRTTIHLKDKWRNMIKADPSLRKRMGV